MTPEMGKNLAPGMVVQISPDVANAMFAYCMLTITEVKDFGVQGYVQSLGAKGMPGGCAYYRLRWNEFEFVGQAVWNNI